jgi:hypothetical protein
LKTYKLGLASVDCRKMEPEFSPTGFLIPFLSHHVHRLKDSRLTNGKGWNSVVRDALKSVRWRIKQIDSIYSDCWQP